MPPSRIDGGFDRNTRMPGMLRELRPQLFKDLIGRERPFVPREQVHVHTAADEPADVGRVARDVGIVLEDLHDSFARPTVAS